MTSSQAEFTACMFIPSYWSCFLCQIMLLKICLFHPYSIVQINSDRVICSMETELTVTQKICQLFSKSNLEIFLTHIEIPIRICNISKSGFQNSWHIFGGRDFRQVSMTAVRNTYRPMLFKKYSLSWKCCKEPELTDKNVGCS